MGATINILCNPGLLTDIRSVPSGITIHSHGGSRVTNTIGLLPGFSYLWIDRVDVVNILSLKSVHDRFRVTFDNETNAFIVHRPSWPLLFSQRPQGLYIHDLGSWTSFATLSIIIVEENAEGHTLAQFAQACTACQGQSMMGHPSDLDMGELVSMNGIQNCPITTANITAAARIFSPNLPSLRVKIVRTQPSPAVGNYVPVPR